MTREELYLILAILPWSLIAEILTHKAWLVSISIFVQVIFFILFRREHRKNQEHQLSCKYIEEQIQNCFKKEEE